MQVQNVCQQLPRMNNFKIYDDVRDFAPQMKKMAESAFEKLKYENGGNNIIDFDIIIPLDEFTFLAKKQPENFIQKTITFFGLEKKAQIILEKISSENDIIDACKTILKKLG